MILAKAQTLSQFVGAHRDTGSVLVWFRDNVLPCLAPVLCDKGIAEAASWPHRMIWGDDGEVREAFENALAMLDRSIDAVQDILNADFGRSTYRLSIDALEVLGDAAGRAWFDGMPSRDSTAKEGVSLAQHWLRQARELLKKQLMLSPELFAPWPIPAGHCDAWTTLACATVPANCRDLLKPGDIAWRLPAVRMYGVIELLGQVVEGFSGVSPKPIGFHRVIGPRPEQPPEWPDTGELRKTWLAFLKRLDEIAAARKTEWLSVLLKLCTVLLGDEHRAGDTSYGGLCGASGLQGVDLHRLGRLWNACGTDEISTLLADGLRDASERLASSPQDTADSPFKWPKGAERKWSLLRIFMDIETNSCHISVGDGSSKTYSFTKMGFEDRKTRTPNQAWSMLGALQFDGGIPVPQEKLERPRRYQQISDLRRRLKAFFGIKSDPLHDVTERVGNIRSYRPQFTMSIHHDVTISVAPNTSWEEISIGLDGNHGLRFEVPHKVTIGQGEETREQIKKFSFSELGLLSRNRPNKVAMTLIGLLRGGGSAAAKRADADMKQLGDFLAKTIPNVTGRPLHNDGDVWSASFDVLP